MIPLVTACGGGSSSASCEQPIREELDPASLTHVIDVDDARFRTNPPTSGPHIAGALPSGIVRAPIPGAVQVAILEGGNVLVQYDPSVSSTDVDQLAGLVADEVVVALNYDLPSPIVATAWTYKLTCDAVDLDALDEFIGAHAGAAIGH